jgi:drug/metabolite transporter (DMT)-like permease
VSIILALTAFFENESLIVENPNDYLILLIYGIGSHAIGGIMIASALVRVTTTEVGIALLLQPTLSFIWEILFFNRSFTMIESVGVVIVLYSIFLSSNRTTR